MTAGVPATVGGVPVLALVRAPGAGEAGVTDPAAKTLTEETAARRNRSFREPS
ncbi:hypothetical protein ACFWWC_09430 [Streptomyces sp. NPDC058642]|uniref:hypothetical protein n=1 Tax=Streptomyces sp. NPDC058642 TaxID=3346572 RepID=UPI00364E53ED